MTSCFSVLFYLVVPSKHKTFAKHLYNVGPMSKTSSRRCVNVIQLFCVGLVDMCYHVCIMYVAVLTFTKFLAFAKEFISSLLLRSCI